MTDGHRSPWRSAGSVAGDVSNSQSRWYVPALVAQQAITSLVTVPPQENAQSAAGEEEHAQTAQSCERLVRVPLEDLQQQESSK